MIGVFARMFTGDTRVTEVTELENDALAIKANGPADLHEVVASDEPPEHFVEKLEYDGGKVYVVPFVEALKEWLGRKRKEAEAAAVSESADEAEA